MKQSYRYNPLLFIVLIALIPRLVSAHYSFHPDIEERVVAITKLLDASPKNTELLFKRGQLHFQHEEYDDALADFESVLQLDPSMEQVQLARASALLRGGWHKSAMVILNAYIQNHHEDTTALLLRGKTFVALEEHLFAARDFEHAIEHLHSPTPDQYIELASEYVQAGESHTVRALQSIDAGIKRLGPLVTLQLFAIDLEQKLGRIDEALKRLDTIAVQSQRKEQFLLQRGTILENAHRFEEANLAYKAVLDAIKKLPARHKNTKITIAFRIEATQALIRLRERSTDESTQE